MDKIKITQPYGNRVPSSPTYRPLRDLVGAIETTATGNVVLRIGRELTPLGQWEQVAYVVLSPYETRALSEALAATLHNPNQS